MLALVDFIDNRYKTELFKQQSRKVSDVRLTTLDSVDKMIRDYSTWKDYDSNPFILTECVLIDSKIQSYNAPAFTFHNVIYKPLYEYLDLDIVPIDKYYVKEKVLKTYKCKKYER